MFVLKPNPTFESFVSIGTPQGTVKLKLEFRHKDKPTVAAWVKAAAEKPATEVLPQIIVGWHDVADKDGVAVPYSTEALAQLLNDYHAAGDAIFTHYLKALHGELEKN